MRCCFMCCCLWMVFWYNSINICFRIFCFYLKWCLILIFWIRICGFLYWWVCIIWVFWCILFICGVFRLIGGAWIDFIICFCVSFFNCLWGGCYCLFPIRLLSLIYNSGLAVNIVIVWWNWWGFIGGIGWSIHWFIWIFRVIWILILFVCSVCFWVIVTYGVYEIMLFGCRCLKKFFIRVGWTCSCIGLKTIWIILL